MLGSQLTGYNELCGWCEGGLFRRLAIKHLIKAGFFTFVIGITLTCTLVYRDKVLSMDKRPIKVLTVQHKGQVLDLNPGESFLLVLNNPGSGGYIVQEPPEFDPQILILLKMEKKPPSDPNRDGDFGRLEWTFEAIKEGISAIIVRASRPWERGKAPIVLFEGSVLVTK